MRFIGRIMLRFYAVGGNFNIVFVMSSRGSMWRICGLFRFGVVGTLSGCRMWILVRLRLFMMGSCRFTVI